MKYKVGDKVRIKSKEWYEKESDELGRIGIRMLYFDKKMSSFCGDCAEIMSLVKSDTSDSYYYKLNIDCHENFWTDEMFEGLVSDEKPLISSELIKDIAEVVKTHNLGVSISENEGKLIIEPLKVEEDLPIDTPCMVSDDKEDWILRYYYRKDKCFSDGLKSSNSKQNDFDGWLYIIEFSKFNPNDIEESLKYNIVK